MERNGDRVFADEYSALSHEIAEAVSDLLVELPREEGHLDFEPIRINEDNRRKGGIVLFFAGALLDPDRKGVYLSSKRDRTILAKLGVDYRAVERG